MKKVLKKLHYYIFLRQSKLNYVIFLIPFVVIFGYKIYHHSFVNQGCYTIGKVYKIYWPVISHKTILYQYTFKEITYKGTDIYKRGKEVEENKRYLVRFSLNDPRESDIFQNIPVPDSIKGAPKEGWKEMPEWAREKEK